VVVVEEEKKEEEACRVIVITTLCSTRPLLDGAATESRGSRPATVVRRLVWRC
jgi:hypothetical protein